MNHSTSNPKLELNLDSSPFEVVPLTNQQDPLSSPLPIPPHPLHQYHHSHQLSTSSRTSDFRSEYNKSIHQNSDQPLLPPNPLASGSTSTRGSVAFQHSTLDNGSQNDLG